MVQLALGLTILFFSLLSFGQFTEGSAPENNQKYAYYYQFADKPLVNQKFQPPTEIMGAALQQLSQPITSINLLLWNLVSKQLPFPTVPYDRKKQFGDWIVDHRGGNCLNTRAVVLVRDSSSKVGMSPGNQCSVQSGTWFDPYSNRPWTNSSEVQIDHFVPLKHVYISGGFQWDALTKCLYTNYIGYRTHLIPVASKENLKKGDATPYSYLPPNKNFVCGYIANWLRVKKIWNLALIPPETQAIAKAFKDYRCDANQFNMTVAELIQQRKFMNDNYRLCESAMGVH